MNELVALLNRYATEYYTSDNPSVQTVSMIAFTESWLS